ncbi:hypothetical protein [Mesoplasma melaleucae]|uniref:Uncharacterized protein n=1 Tax=Mesoplasma melaleucae TaxID=81459 RepID=A0A2K8NVZ2_9MOLU|nr:hypothetical protein [Mesoplasma melaleucae]ATZ18002.1 hypothetical protein EMELA_v1c04590 [Mesoplasma melaleucae]
MNLQKDLTSFSELPVLFINGKKDLFIDYHNSVLMYYEKAKELSENTKPNYLWWIRS